MKKIKLAYIGGGSKAWARVFMNDLALTDGLCGEIALYDIDVYAAQRNKKIGEKINECKETVSKWEYTVCEKLDDALRGADFVACSILPGTFDEMASDVHAPEEYGIYQSVGDTVGPGGVLRAMRTAPIYEGFAAKIKEICPNAWVINLTNPMYICTKTLYDVFPDVKAFGCCHEVFGAEDFLCDVAKEMLGIPRPDRHDIYVDASGINHFTWITEARLGDTDLLSLLPAFMEKYYESGYPADIGDNPFAYGNKVKMDLYKRFGVLGAAGDRHLVEFLNNSWYIGSEADVEKWKYHLTSVDYRKRDMKNKIEKSERIAAGLEAPEVKKSNEELIQMMKSLLGFGKTVTNANVINRGQMPDLPLSCIVETNCEFNTNSLKPIIAKRLPSAVQNLVYRNAMNLETTYYGIKNRDLDVIFEAFINQPLCSSLSYADARDLFGKMIVNTKEYLKDYYDLSGYVK
ncbi:MAG: alpha-glucosidase/alpha-galactosidase [Clostridiales bacterium]|nr:alpha-glucosidase/alpha-galactosidase [Clostridiales bacterium]